MASGDATTALVLANAERSLAEPLTLATATVTAKLLAGLMKSLPPAASPDQITRLLVLRGRALSALATMSRADKSANFADGAQQLFAQGLQRCGGSYALMGGWRPALAYACAWEIIAAQTESPTVYQKSIGIAQVRGREREVGCGYVFV